MSDKKKYLTMVRDISLSFQEARKLDDEHLFYDHLGWIKESFNKGWFNYPMDYDYDTNVWTIGLCMAQLERYNGVVIKTKNGVLPDKDIPNDENKKRLTEKPKLKGR